MHTSRWVLEFGYVLLAKPAAGCSEFKLQFLDLSILLFTLPGLPCLDHTTVPPRDQAQAWSRLAGSGISIERRTHD